MKRKNLKLIILFFVFIISVSGCGTTNIENSSIETEKQNSSEIISQSKESIFEEKTDIFLISNNVYGQEYFDGNLIDMNSLNTNDEVTVTGQADTGWYRINYNGGVAFVSNNYLSNTKIEIAPPDDGDNTNEENPLHEVILCKKL